MGAVLPTWRIDSSGHDLGPVRPGRVLPAPGGAPPGMPMSSQRSETMVLVAMPYSPSAL